MRNTSATILPALAILLLSACGTVGTDTIVELPIDQAIEGFSAIEISGPIETNVVYGADHRVRITANENFVDDVEYRVAGDALRISFQGYERFIVTSWPRTNVQIDVEITLPGLREIAARHGATIDLTATVEDHLSIHASDAGSARVRGSAATAAVSATRGGNVTGDLEVGGELVLRAEHGSDVTLAGTASPVSGSFWHGATADLARMAVQSADIEAHHGSTVHVSATRSLVALSTHGSVVELGAIPESLSVREESGGKVNGPRSVSVSTDE